MTNNKTVLSWLDEMKALLNPDNVMWIDGSEEQLESLRAIAVQTGEMKKLNDYSQSIKGRSCLFPCTGRTCGRIEKSNGPGGH